jgi:hypothetical protein
MSSHPKVLAEHQGRSATLDRCSSGAGWPKTRRRLGDCALRVRMEGRCGRRSCSIVALGGAGARQRRSVSGGTSDGAMGKKGLSGGSTDVSPRVAATGLGARDKRKAL